MIAEYGGIDALGLGIKGKSGVLKSKETRRNFLARETH